MNIRNRNKKLVLKKFYMNILVISSHPDDEVLGMGGTIYKLANEGHKIYLCVVTDGNCGSTKQEKIRKESAIKASKFLGIKNSYETYLFRARARRRLKFFDFTLQKYNFPSFFMT